MKRRLMIGIGALCASWSLADQPLSVYPAVPNPPRYLQVSAEEMNVAKGQDWARPERAPQPLPVSPTIGYPSYATATMPGTIVPAPATTPVPQPQYTPFVPGGAACATCGTPACESCGVPCGTPLFRTGSRPCLDRIAAWLGYRPGPRVIPTMIPNSYQHRPLHTYVQPERAPTISCATESCTTKPPLVGFNLIAPVRPRAAILPNLRPLSLGSTGTCTSCYPAMPQPVMAQPCTTGCQTTPGYLTQHAYPAAQYAPAPTLLSRIKSFFTPQRYGFSPNCWTNPPAYCPTTGGPMVYGSSSAWVPQAGCVNGGCGTPGVPAQPMATPQSLPQSMPEKAPAPKPEPKVIPPATPSASLLPGFRFATPLTHIGATAAQPVQYRVPAANVPFSNP